MESPYGSSRSVQDDVNPHIVRLFEGIVFA